MGFVFEKTPWGLYLVHLVTFRASTLYSQLYELKNWKKLRIANSNYEVLLQIFYTWNAIFIECTFILTIFFYLYINWTKALFLNIWSYYFVKLLSTSWKRVFFIFSLMSLWKIIKNRNAMKKICIGYVLKSADVGTLFSSRHSENSSQAHTRRHPHTLTHTCAHQCTLVHTNAHSPALLTPAHTHTQPSIPTHKHTYP